jgi:esterase/lipase superfamily enzyme
MNIEYHKWHSPNLGQEMELKVYGHAGKPILVFPTQGGRFYEYEDFGMVEACRGSLDAGKIRLFAVDSIDGQSWTNWNLHPADRARRHEDYDRYVVQEVMPFIRGYGGPEAKALPGTTGQAITTGCSMGAYHAANFFFRHPDCFDGCIVLSGLFRLNIFIGDYVDETIYFNTPLAYLPNMNDPWYLDQYRQSHIIICVGQGAWEEQMRADAAELRGILDAKGVPAWIDFWGHDVDHDWPWWRVQMPYFLGKLNL